MLFSTAPVDWFTLPGCGCWKAGLRVCFRIWCIQALLTKSELREPGSPAPPGRPVSRSRGQARATWPCSALDPICHLVMAVTTLSSLSFLLFPKGGDTVIIVLPFTKFLAKASPSGEVCRSQESGPPWAGT